MDALHVVTEGKIADVRAAAQAARAEIRLEAGSAHGGISQSLAANREGVSAWRSEAVGAADAALQDRKGAVIAAGRQRADQARQAATQAADKTRAEAHVKAQEARSLGQSKAASARADEDAVRSAKAAAARELARDTMSTVDTAAQETAAGMRAQGGEVAGAMTEIAAQVGADLSGHRQGVVDHMNEQSTRAKSTLASAAATGGTAVARRRDATLAAIERNEAQAIARLRQEEAAQRKAILDAGRKAAEHLNAAASSAVQEVTRHVEQVCARFVSEAADEAASSAVVEAATAHLTGSFEQLANGLSARAGELGGTLSTAASTQRGRLATTGSQATENLALAREQGGQQIAAAATTTVSGLAATLGQTRTAGDAALSSFTSVLDQNVGSAGPALDDLASRHTTSLGDQSAEMQSKISEPAGSLRSRIDTAQQRAAERASQSWLSRQLSDLWETVSSPEFLVGLAVGLLVGAIIILSAGTATPFVIMAAGIAAGAAGAAASTMTGNIREGKRGWDVLDNVGRNALIGGLAGGVAAGVYLFGAGLVVGLGLTGTGAAIGGFVTLEAAAVISNTVANVASGRPWDENLLTAMLLAPLVEFLVKRIPGVKGKAQNEPPPEGGSGGPVKTLPGKARLRADIAGSRNFAQVIRAALENIQRPGARARLEARLVALEERLARLDAEVDAATTVEELAARRQARELAQRDLQDLNREVRAAASRFPQSWDDFLDRFHAEFEAEIKRFRGNDDLDPTPRLRGGEGQLFLSGPQPLQALKRWFKSRVGDMAQSIRLLRAARSGVAGNPRLAAVMDVVEVTRTGSDWVQRSFDPDSIPLSRALGDPAAASARQQAIAALDGMTDGTMQNILGKLRDNSENLHWSPRRGKILVIDMQ